MSPFLTKKIYKLGEYVLYQVPLVINGDNQCDLNLAVSSPACFERTAESTGESDDSSKDKKWAYQYENNYRTWFDIANRAATIKGCFLESKGPWTHAT